MNKINQEQENINISDNYYNLIKQLSEDYIKYITSYKFATIDYLKKLSLNQEKYISKLNEIKNELKNIDGSHIISLTSTISKIIKHQITSINLFIQGIGEKLENFEETIKTKSSQYINLITPFTDVKNELFKKYREIEKLRLSYMTNISFAEESIHKFYMRQNNKIKNNRKLSLVELENNPDSFSFEEQVNNSIQKTKKIEEDYITNITLVKTVEKRYIDSADLSTTKARKILCEMATSLKELISDCLVFLKNLFKVPLSEVDTYINEIISLDEYNKTNNIIKSSYIKNNNLKQINPEKYTLKFFQYNESNKNNINNNINSLPRKDSGLENNFQELDFLQEKEIFMTIKKMMENFDLLEKNNYNIIIEEEKLRCKYLTLKILSFAPKSKLYSNSIPNISKEEIEEIDKMLNKKQNRIIFIQKLSQFRTRGIFEIPEKEYKILSRLFNKIAKIVESEKDYESAVNIIILSQTYYIIKNAQKEYLQNEIMNNDLFKSKKFWETFTNYTINKEVELNKQTEEKNGIIIENERENEEKYSNIAFAQLVPMINNMMEFRLDINIIEEIIIPLIKQYKIIPEFSEVILSPINEKKKEIEIINREKDENREIKENKEIELNKEIEKKKKKEVDIEITKNENINKSNEKKDTFSQNISEDTS